MLAYLTIQAASISLTNWDVRPHLIMYFVVICQKMKIMAIAFHPCLFTFAVLETKLPQ